MNEQNKEETEIKYLGQDDIRDYIMKKDYEIYKLQQKIDKAVEILKLCNSKCAKETIDILRGNDE